jgi:hypothetical protein
MNSTQKTKKSILKKLFKWACGFGILFLLVCVLLSFLITWPRSRKMVGNYPNNQIHQSFEVMTDDHNKIYCDFFPGGETQPIILLSHGIGSNRQQYPQKRKLLLSQGFSLAVYDIRGHGSSEGLYHTLGYNEALDIKAVITWLKEKYPNKKIIGWGHSLGAAACVNYQARFSGFDKLLIQGCFAELTETIRVHAKVWAKFPEEILFITKPVEFFFRLRLGLLDVDFDPATLASSINCPTLVITGENDIKAPVGAALAIFENLNTTKKHLLILAGHGHSGWFTDTSSQQALLAFLHGQTVNH